MTDPNPIHFPNSPDQMPSKDILLSMSGFDFMCAIRDGTLPGPPIAQTLNFTGLEVEPGKVTFTGTPTFAHTNPMQGVHGGWYGGILDSALGCAVMTVTPKGSVYTTLEYKINITRALPTGREARAIATVQHSGRSTAVAVAELRGVEDGKLYATGSTTCIIMKVTP